MRKRIRVVTSPSPSSSFLRSRAIIAPAAFRARPRGSAGLDPRRLQRNRLEVVRHYTATRRESYALRMPARTRRLFFWAATAVAARRPDEYAGSDRVANAAARPILVVVL